MFRRQAGAGRSRQAALVPYLENLGLFLTENVADLDLGDRLLLLTRAHACGERTEES